jgi:hypothetical protein
MENGTGIQYTISIPDYLNYGIQIFWVFRCRVLGSLLQYILIAKKRAHLSDIFRTCQLSILQIINTAYFLKKKTRVLLASNSVLFLACRSMFIIKIKSRYRNIHQVENDFLSQIREQPSMYYHFPHN